MFLSDFPNTIYWIDCLYLIVCPCLFCQIFIDHKVVGLFLGSLFSSTDIYVCFYASTMLFFFFFNFNFHLRTCILILERRERREREGERNIDVREKHRLVSSLYTPTGDWTCNLGMCPDWEWNPWPFSLQDDTQSTGPHWPGLPCCFDYYGLVI